MIVMVEKESIAVSMRVRSAGEGWGCRLTWILMLNLRSIYRIPALPMANMEVMALATSLLFSQNMVRTTIATRWAHVKTRRDQLSVIDF
jgi:hypothetical protein